jgi:hypothetical protein
MSNLHDYCIIHNNSSGKTDGGNSMKHLVAFNMQDGGTIIVEVEEPETGGTTRASRRPGELAEEAKETFEQALSKIRPATEKVIGTLRSLAHKPDEIEMEFGFNMSAAAGVVIASASAEANYKVTLRWKSEIPENNP